MFNPSSTVALVRYRPAGAIPFFVAGSGVLIHPRWFITAAHCTLSPETTNVVINADDLAHPAPEQLFHIEEARYFQHYASFPRRQSDIALVKLRTEVEGFTPIELARVAPEPGATLYAYGWGEDDFGVQPTGRMKKIEMTAEATLFNLITAKPTRGHNGTCYGDSGGPLVATDGKLVGIANSITVPLFCSLGADDFLFLFEEITSWLQASGL